MNKRKQKIVEHALALFLEKGIRNTSIQDIIERARISKGTFYNYFSSKNECVGALLEQLRYEAGLHRNELLVGKDPKDLDVLIDQIAILSELNQKRGMAAVFEEIFYSGDKELKKLVLHYRISELKWLSERLVDVYGEELRPHALEGSVIFYGIMQHLLFAGKILHQDSVQPRAAAASAFHYRGFITDALIHSNTAVLDVESFKAFNKNLNREQLDINDSIKMLKELLEDPDVTKVQEDLTNALLSELERDEPREAVIQALLQPFIESYQDSSRHHIVKEISGLIWYSVRQR